MADYISREAAIDAIWKPEVRPNALIFDALRRACEEEVKHIPSADVVDVVRCKDCRYFHNGYDEKCCINHKGVVVTDENGFCHHAERRADNG